MSVELKEVVKILVHELSRQEERFPRWHKYLTEKKRATFEADDESFIWDLEKWHEKHQELVDRFEALVTEGGESR